MTYSRIQFQSYRINMGKCEASCRYASGFVPGGKNKDVLCTASTLEVVGWQPRRLFGHLMGVLIGFEIPRVGVSILLVRMKILVI